MPAEPLNDVKEHRRQEDAEKGDAEHGKGESLFCQKQRLPTPLFFRRSTKMASATEMGWPQVF